VIKRLRVLDLHRAAVLAFLAVALWHATYSALRGAVWATDTNGFHSMGDRLVAYDFHYGAFIRDFDPHRRWVPYLGWLTVVAMLKATLGAMWTTGVVVVNIFASAGAAALVTSAVARITESRRATVAALLVYLGAFETVQWTRYLLSDASYSLLPILFFAVWCHAWVSGRRIRYFVAVLVTLTLLIVFYRPPGIAMVPVAIFGIGLLVARQKGLASAHGWRRLPLVTFIAFALVSAFAIAVNTWIVRDPSRWPFPFAAQFFQEVAAHYRLGEVMWDRLSMAHAPPTSYMDYIAIALDRFAHFFYFTTEAFSARHTLLGALFFIPTYGLAFVAIWRALHGDAPRESRWRIPVLLATLVVLSVAVFHSLVWLDFDWRFRLPVVPFLIFLAAVGVDVIRSPARSAHLDVG
jgi:hypothetical protein